MDAHCGRCVKNLTHLVELSKSNFTVGYYEVEHGFWSQFADKHEVYLCDSCMWKDERYVALYGRYSGVEYAHNNRGAE